MQKQINTDGSGSTILKLQKEAESTPLFKAACQVFESRKRARNEITFTSLKLALEEKTRSELPRTDIEYILTFLANLGIGVLKKNSAGEVTALVGLKVTIQSIGAAGLEGSNLEQFKTKSSKQKYEKVSHSQPAPKARPLPPPPIRSEPGTTTITPSRRAYVLFLTVMIDGNPSVFPGPKNLNPEDLGEFLANFNGLVRNLSK